MEIDVESIRKRAAAYAVLHVTKEEFLDRARYDQLAHELAIDAIRMIEYLLRLKTKEPS